MSYKEKILNAETGEIIWRDYTAKEIAEVEKEQTEALKRVQVTEARELKRQSALIKLAALGLTEDEIDAL